MCNQVGAACIADGLDLLLELGAVDKKDGAHRITRVGREIAQNPARRLPLRITLDPRTALQVFIARDAKPRKTF